MVQADQAGLKDACRQADEQRTKMQLDAEALELRSLPWCPPPSPPPPPSMHPFSVPLSFLALAWATGKVNHELVLKHRCLMTMFCFPFMSHTYALQSLVM